MILKTWNALRRYWESDRGLSLFLGLLILLVFVLPPLAPPGEGRGVLFDVFFALLLVAGVATLTTRFWLRMVLLAVTFAVLAVRWGPASSPATLAFASLVAIGLMALVVLGQAFRRGAVNVHRIQGAVAAYLLLGLAWASAYELVAALAPGAFTGAQALAHDPQGWIYFSFVTLTTVGYGDVTPVHPAARSLAMMEALTGQLYPAILLARLVTLAVPSPQDD
jgi:Ion channel